MAPSFRRTATSTKDRPEKRRRHTSPLPSSLPSRSSRPPQRSSSSWSQRRASRGKGPTTGPRTKGLCSFCEQTPAVVSVDMNMGGRGKVATSLCWLHYYTTRAVRVEAKSVKILGKGMTNNAGNDDDNDDKTGSVIEQVIQESGVQGIFAEAFTELQRELAEESARSFKNRASDPLGIIHNYRSKPKLPPVKAVKRQKHDNTAGGFLKKTALPDRFVETQRKLRQQTLMEATSLARSTQSTSTYARRKPARKPIWNLAMEPVTDRERAATVASTGQLQLGPAAMICSCGSSDVTQTGNITNRNNDMMKAETWGFKDRSEVVHRYRCNKCGKTWNEED